MLDYEVHSKVSDYRRCFPKVLVNDILVELERILDYAGVGLERFNCIMMIIMHLSM